MKIKFLLKLTVPVYVPNVYIFVNVFSNIVFSVNNFTRDLTAVNIILKVPINI